MDAFFHKGIELAEIGKHDEAIKNFDTLLKKHVNNVNVIYAKARSKAALNEIDESLALLKQAISKSPKVIKKWAKQEKIFEKLQDDERFRKIIN
jgi:tetratricopeptide (TPR) repeat protein